MFFTLYHYTLALPPLEVPRTLSYGDECAIRTTPLRLAVATTAFDTNRYTAPELPTHSPRENFTCLGTRQSTSASLRKREQANHTPPPSTRFDTPPLTCINHRPNLSIYSRENHYLSLHRARTLHCEHAIGFKTKPTAFDLTRYTAVDVHQHPPANLSIYSRATTCPYTVRVRFTASTRSDLTPNHTAVDEYQPRPNL
jgi:hypothetical protein